MIIPFSTVSEMANKTKAPFFFPNLLAKNGETIIPTRGAKNKLSPIVRIFNGVNSQKNCRNKELNL